MTREEAIAILKTPIHCADKGDEKEMREALELAIKALSQEPCDDTVSIRKDALKTRVGNIVAYNVEWLKKHWQMEMDIVCGVKPCDDAISRDAVIEWLENATYEDIIDAVGTELSFLPSVTQKSGKWIAYEVQLPDRTILNYRCSVCGRKLIGYSTETLSEAPFCHCGARMESEDKE